MHKDIDERAYRLALRTVTLQQDLEFRRIVRWKLLGQLVSAATSIGANLAEASAAQTKPDFIARVSVAKKEARETQFWLRLAADANILEEQDLGDLREEAEEVARIISAIARNARTSDRRG
jgi:four helix bundle protein